MPIQDALLLTRDSTLERRRNKACAHPRIQEEKQESSNFPVMYLTVQSKPWQKKTTKKL